MNTTLYSQQNRLVPSNIVKFRCRIDGSEGLDVHRDFTGVYYPRWRGLYLDEMRQILNQYRVIPLFPFEIYTKEDDSHFMTDDFEVGKTVFLGKTSSARDKAAKRFIITDVDATNLLTTTTSESRRLISGKSLSQNAIDLIEKFRDAFIHRAGGSVELGLKDIGRRFRSVDASGNRNINKADFQKSVKDAHLEFSGAQLEEIFRGFDLNSEGQIPFDDFMEVIRGPMSDHRKKVVAQMFRRLDIDGDGNITIQEIKNRFNASGHPDVRNGSLSVDQLLTAFLAIWDTRDKNGAVSFPEFSDYYGGVSASVEDDELFEAIVVSSWKVLM